MTLSITLNAPSKLPIEVEGIVPAALREITLKEIERLPIFHGNQKLPLAELFTVAGSPAEERVVWAGNLGGVHWLGAKMASGEVHIEGDAGRHLGSEMHGGSIHVTGNASDFVGTHMHGGLIHIRGSAGNRLGGAVHGSPRGMTRGMIIVNGNVGDEAGIAMRRGLIAVGGNAGDFLGAGMLAGSIVVLGTSGASTGAGMRRGTIAVLGKRPHAPLPTFRFACRYQPSFLRLLARQIVGYGLTEAEQLCHAPVELFHGDMGELGRGELLLASA